MKKKIKDNIPILIILALSAILRLVILIYYGPEYSLNSDDLSYVNAAIRFCESGEITIHGVISAQIMPGMIWLIAPLVFIFGTGKVLWIAMKLLWILMSLGSIWGVYKIVKLYSKSECAILAVLFFFALDFMWMDNLILTETPFMLSFVWLIYSSLQLAETHKNKYFWYICFWYMFALLMKATIAPFPLFLFVYLWAKKYDMKRMFRQLGIAILVVLLFIVPWSVRNYVRFDHFIPLTYGAGNPKLLGSYQGTQAPLDEDLDFQKNVYQKMPKKMQTYFDQNGELRADYQGEKWYEDYMVAYYSLELDGMKADYRLQEWKNRAPLNYIKSICIDKPMAMLYNSFYWEEVFGIPIETNYFFRKIDILLFVISIIAMTLEKKRIKELLFLISIYAFQIFVYSVTFVFSRYAQTLYFIRFIIIGWGVQVIINKILIGVNKKR